MVFRILLERKGFIIRKHYNPEDVAFVIQDFKEFLVNNNALDTNKIGEDKIQDFLRSRNLESKKIKPSEEKSKNEADKNLNSGD